MCVSVFVSMRPSPLLFCTHSVYLCVSVCASSLGLVSVCHDCSPAWGIGPFCCAHPGTAKKSDEEEEEEREEEDGACCF